MECEFEPISQKVAKHRHLFLAGWPDLAWSYGDDVVVVGLDPGGSAGDGSGIQVVCCCDEQLEGVRLFDEAIVALHGDVATGFRIRLHRLDGCYLECVECGSWGWGLRQHSRDCDSKSYESDLSDHSVTSPRTIASTDVARHASACFCSLRCLLWRPKISDTEGGVLRQLLSNFLT